jgi:threonine dehydrogenase-like Zn-dependent dehydrogenase
VTIRDIPDAAVHTVLVPRLIAALRDHPHGVVEVTGDPELADRLRDEHGLRVAEDEVASPIAVVDTTGSPHVIRGALRRLADHGVLLLAGGLRGDDGQLNYYEDLHRRSLTIVAV